MPPAGTDQHGGEIVDAAGEHKPPGLHVDAGGAGQEVVRQGDADRGYAASGQLQRAPPDLRPGRECRAAHVDRHPFRAELHGRTDEIGQGLGGQLHGDHPGLDVTQLDLAALEQRVTIKLQALEAEADRREGDLTAEHLVQGEGQAADATRHEQAGDEGEGVDVSVDRGDIPGPLPYVLLHAGFNEGGGGQLNQYRHSKHAGHQDDEEAPQSPLLIRCGHPDRPLKEVPVCEDPLERSTDPYLSGGARPLGGSEERMERRVLVRGLAGAALAIAVGDLAGLAARGARRPHRPSSGPLADSMPPGLPRTPPRPDSLSDRTATAPPEPLVPSVTMRALFGRGAWGALPPGGPLPAHRVERLTIHHTGVVATDPTAAPARLRAYQRHHQRRGLADLAYHVFVDRAGNLFEGRALSAAPDTFTDYDPSGHFTACLDGNYDEQSPTRAQLDALVDLLTWATERFGVRPATIRGHRAYVATRCPGAALHALIIDDTLRRRVEQRRASGQVELVPANSPVVTGYRS